MKNETNIAKKQTGALAATCLKLMQMWVSEYRARRCCFTIS